MSEPHPALPVDYSVPSADAPVCSCGQPSSPESTWCGGCGAYTDDDFCEEPPTADVKASEVPADEQRRLLAVLADPSSQPSDLTFAAEEAGIIGTEEALEAIHCLAYHPSALVREGVVYGLSKFKDSHRACAMVQCLMADGSAGVREAAREAYDEMRPTAEVPTLPWETLDKMEAQLDESTALRHLASVLEIVLRDGGWMRAEDQIVLRTAREFVGERQR